MRLAFTLPSAQIRRPLNVGGLFSDPRGLTGSEASLVGYSTGLAKLGHEVSVYTNVTAPGEVDGARFRPYGEWSEASKEPRDAVIAWMSSTPLMPVPDGAFRVAMEQCSDFGNHVPGWERFADSLCLLSRSHVEQMTPQSTFPREKIRIAHNGVDPQEFKPLRKVPGSCLWASSHDRGLHNLLELWPEIRRRVPWATLKVCYDTTGLVAFSKRNDPHPLIRELAQRSTYSLEALRRLEAHGVQMLGSVSRRDIARLMGESEALAYPCQPVRFTETFGSSVLEAMAAGCVPVITSADCFAEMWCPVAPHIAAPFTENKSAYLELITEVLTDSKFRERYRSACIGHAHRFTWATLVEKFERFMETRGAEGLEGVA
jgi:hypothetical protein